MRGETVGLYTPLRMHPSGDIRTYVLPLRCRRAHPPPEQVITLRGLLCDRRQILGQQMALLHQRLGSLLYPAQVVLPGSIALLDRGTWVASGLAFGPRGGEGES